MSLAAAGLGLTLNGAGPLISLGIENVISSPAQIAFYYNFFALITLAIIGFSSGQRDTRFVALLLPLWSAFCMYAGWFIFPNQLAAFGILVVCTMIAMMTYMQDVIHERFGIAGPGSRIVKIVMFLIVLQTTVVFVNSAQIFPSDVTPIAASNLPYVTIDLNQTTYQASNSGGILQAVVDIASAVPQIAVSALVLFLQVLMGVALFSVILGQIFPWIIAAGAVGVAFLIVLQFAIWSMYILFIVQLFYKPTLDPGW